MLMGPTTVRFRVHIAPVGREVIRVVKPMITLKADVAILLTLSKTDQSGLSAQIIRKELEKEHIPTTIIECNISDSSEIVNEVGSIVSAYPHHEYMYNVSTGARAASIAGVIAGMFWGVRPYHIGINEMAKPVHGEGDLPTVGSPQFVPTFQIPRLDQAAIEALEFIASTKEPISKNLLITELKKTGKVGPRQSKSVTPQALYGQLDSILYKLETWGFVELIGHGKSARVSITETGIEGRKMFFHMLKPRSPLSMLE
ncbi:MAG: hypothetical protein AUH84_07345 [Thaumarchaeota archaeon 13_1_40CM_4_38_7]|nr:MAG: hypothetical protein AUH84_07345 [Thaumarchaeota archaeon 13_1_40CM_4_38_7]OLC93254.1 MAG: hypothetical protein AUI92_03290 [Thaumarchaeota archaeon 13_1_40CM_3_38_6]